jgi:hypothetical protein
MTEDGPEWRRRACKLEAENKLEDAEKAIADGVQHLAFAIVTAQMYRERMHRLIAAGDAAGAREAFTKSTEFAVFYASLATSGGEGAALSAERDRFLKQLRDEYGVKN